MVIGRLFGRARGFKWQKTTRQAWENLEEKVIRKLDPPPQTIK